MCSFDSPGEPWTKEDCQNHYNQMDPKDAEYYQRGNALRSLSGAISTLEKEIEELTAVNNQGQQRDDTVHSLSGAISILEEAVEELKRKRDAIALHHNFLS